jgi:TolB-like protein
MNDALAALALGRRIDLTREPDLAAGGLEIRPTACEVIVGDRTIRLQPRVMQVLIALARAEGRAVSRDRLLEVCWGSVLVGEDALNRCVQRLRRLARGEAAGAFTIETIARIGYRLSVDQARERRARPPVSEPGPSGKPLLAVRPFAKLTVDSRLDDIADGLTEEVTAALLRIRTLFVVAGGLAPPSKAGRSRARDGADDLGARYEVGGSVRMAGGRIRIVAKLSETTTGLQLWARHFDETRKDVFALQDQVALSVAGAVEPCVVAAEVRRVLKHPSDNPGSYELYLRAQPHCTRRSLPAYRLALDLLSRAVALDPDCRSALALAAHLHSQIAIFGWAEDPQANRRQGVELARKAIIVAGDDAVVLAHAATAIARLEGDLDAAADLLKRAVTQNPASSYSWFLSGLHQASFGNADVAVSHLETSLRLDPNAHRSNTVGALAIACFRQGRFQEAAAFARESVQRVDGPTGYACLAGACAQMGQAVAAVAALDRYRALSTLPIAAFARSFLSDPAELEMFLDGIAAAEAATRPQNDSTGEGSVATEP